MIEWVTLALAVASCVICAISASAAVRSNIESEKRYMEALKPELCFSLDRHGQMIMLTVRNIGRAAAKDIHIKVSDLDEVRKNQLAWGSFELYPQQAVQGLASIYKIGNTDWMTIEVEVTYTTEWLNEVSYTQHVSLFTSHEVQSWAKLLDAAERPETDRALLCIATYLFGSIDWANKKADLSMRSLQNDLKCVIESTAKEILKDYGESMHNSTKERTGEINNTDTEGHTGEINNTDTEERTSNEE